MIDVGDTTLPHMHMYLHPNLRSIHPQRIPTLECSSLSMFQIPVHAKHTCQICSEVSNYVPVLNAILFGSTCHSETRLFVWQFHLVTYSCHAHSFISHQLLTFVDSIICHIEVPLYAHTIYARNAVMNIPCFWRGFLPTQILLPNYVEQARGKSATHVQASHYLTPRQKWWNKSKRAHGMIKCRWNLNAAGHYQNSNIQPTSRSAMCVSTPWYIPQNIPNTQNQSQIRVQTHS